MAGKRCVFCIAKDAEIARLHALVEKLASRTAVPQFTTTGPIGPNVMETLREQVDGDEPPEEGAIPMQSMAQAFDAVHGDGAWADLSGLSRAEKQP